MIAVMFHIPKGTHPAFLLANTTELAHKLKNSCKLMCYTDFWRKFFVNASRIWSEIGHEFPDLGYFSPLWRYLLQQNIIAITFI
jgi:hypothetical protein